jgi:lipoprotein-anchoring transpeptidase ErfK/SrfK
VAGRVSLVLVSALLVAGCGLAGTAEPEEGLDGGVQIEIGGSEEGSDPSPTADDTTDPVAGDGTAGAGTDDEAGADGSEAAPESPTVRYSVVAQAVGGQIIARAEPAADAAEVSTLANPTVSGSPLVFRAVDEQSAPAGWLQVHLPIEPNGTTGWVRRDEVTLSENPYRVEVDRGTHSLRVFNLDELWVETDIAVGTGNTPTPVGEFYLLELIRTTNPGGAYGPYAFGLSGFSEVLESFGESDSAIIGLHGTNDPSSLGTDVSSGCIRLPNEVITELAQTLPLGTPIVIT